MNFRALEKSMSWKSPGNLFVKKGTDPVYHAKLVGNKEVYVHCRYISQSTLFQPMSSVSSIKFLHSLYYPGFKCLVPFLTVV